mgnify:FL=1
MKTSGWEMRPIGWVVMAILVGAIIFYMWKWLQRPSQKNDKNI